MAFWVRADAEPSPRDVLGVGLRATADDIRLAYKKRALECHPDKGGDPDLFVKVRNAYEVLKAAGSTGAEHSFSKIPQRAPHEYKTPYPHPFTGQRLHSIYCAPKTSYVRSGSPLLTKLSQRAPHEYKTPYAHGQRTSNIQSESPSVVASPKKRMKRTMEQEISSAFASVSPSKQAKKSPTNQAKNSVPVPKPSESPRASQSDAVANKKSPTKQTKNLLPVPKLSECPGASPDAVADAMNRLRAMPIAKLWEILTQMDGPERERAIHSLPLDVRSSLGDFLKARKHARDNASRLRPHPDGICEEQPVIATSSSSSSSSSSSASSSQITTPVGSSSAFSHPLSCTTGGSSTESSVQCGSSEVPAPLGSRAFARPLNGIHRGSCTRSQVQGSVGSPSSHIPAKKVIAKRPAKAPSQK